MSETSRVHRYLVTSRDEDRMKVWWPTSGVANWIEGRANKHGTETWIVTVFDDDAADFLAAAAAVPEVTVERLHGSGDHEQYELVQGQPGTGWTGAP